MLSRRSFLAASGAALTAFSIPAKVKNPVPAMFDHLLLGCKDLPTGIGFVERFTGVRAAFGGIHPGRGTQNALLSLGERQYLEIIAPDPAQAGSTNPRAVSLQGLVEPRLVGWAVHPVSLADLAEKLRVAGIVFDGPTPGSRKRPDGRLLQWRTLDLKDDASGLLPFFIEWSAGSPHPSTDAPQGCRLVRFELATADPDALNITSSLLSLDALIVKGVLPQLRARIASGRGQFDLTS